MFSLQKLMGVTNINIRKLLTLWLFYMVLFYII